MTSYSVAVLAGDGIGPEVMEQALKIIQTINQKTSIHLETSSALVGGAAIDAAGHALPQETLSLCEKSHAILFGSIGGPQWESLPADQQPERAALLPLRKHFKLFANLRPAKIFPALAGASPLKKELVQNGLDVLVVRELTGGIYFGQPKELTDQRGLDTLVYTVPEIERIAHVAFSAAKNRLQKVTSIDKANVLSSMVLWRQTVEKIAKQYPDIQLNHMYVDNAAMQLVKNPGQFDVLLCGNMFGDILSDEASMITGSLGMLPSASINESNFGLYEPSGGSAPDIAGLGIANPIAQILSLALLLRYSLKQEELAQKIEQAVEKTISEGYRTADIYEPNTQKVDTSEMGALIIKNISW